MSVVNTVETAVADVESQLGKLETAYQTEKSKLVAVITNHIADHQKQAAAHAAEIAAAQAVLAKAIPSATPAATQAAAFVLTAPGWTQRVINFIGRNWRYIVLGGIAVGVVVALHAGLVKL